MVERKRRERREKERERVSRGDETRRMDGQTVETVCARATSQPANQPACLWESFSTCSTPSRPCRASNSTDRSILLLLRAAFYPKPCTLSLSLSSVTSPPTLSANDGRPSSSPSACSPKLFISLRLVFSPSLPRSFAFFPKTLLYPCHNVTFVTQPSLLNYASLCVREDAESVLKVLDLIFCGVRVFRGGRLKDPVCEVFFASYYRLIPWIDLKDLPLERTCLLPWC